MDLQKSADWRQHQMGQGRSVSELTLSLSPIQIKIVILGRINMRQRRVLALSMYRKIKPLFPGIQDAFIRHRDGHGLSWIHAEERGISMHQAIDLEENKPHLGFCIRMKRLNLGLSQDQLAKQIQIRRSHLSLIEHGKHQPRLHTLKRLEKALGISLTNIKNQTNALVNASPKPE